MTGRFKIDKECKHSRRYAREDETFPIQSIYVQRAVADLSDLIEITITLPAGMEILRDTVKAGE